ncbi:hypothetical protein [Kribbella sp. NPDC051620]|uniref:hypothetical protein n=1 Tax=Kribbella sp. NPDC051620 TaxID=3364120 RepID=UPI0037990728
MTRLPTRPAGAAGSSWCESSPVKAGERHDEIQPPSAGRSVEGTLPIAPIDGGGT